MPDTEPLKNRGLFPFGPERAQPPKTLVVLGAARGGTSLVAGVLAKLGVFMGRRAAPPVFEDVQLATAVETRAWDQARKIIREYDDAHPVWGFKRPGVVASLERLHPLLRDPYYLVIFRDLAAIAHRNTISMRADPFRSMTNALHQYAVILEHIGLDGVRGLAISNEKALLHPHFFVDRLVDRCGLTDRVTPAQLDAARQFITVDPPDYLQKSRLKFKGHVDRVTKNFVAGWAFIIGHEKPTVLKVSVDGRVVGSVTANRQRNDVRDRGVHPTGQCGFRFEFPPVSAPRSGDEVAVRFDLGGDDVGGSPRTLS